MERHVLRESGDSVVTGIYTQQRRGILVEGAFVITEVRFVCRADFHHDCPALVDAVGQPERPANLDQLSPRHHHFPPRAQRRQDQQGRRGVVVHHHRRRRARQPAQEFLGVVIALTAQAGLEVDLHVAAPTQPRQRLHGPPRQHRPPEARVQDNARRVNHHPQPLRLLPHCERFHRIHQRPNLGRGIGGPELLPIEVQRLPDGIQHNRARVQLYQFAHPRLVKQHGYRRQVSPWIGWNLSHVNRFRAPLS